MIDPVSMGGGRVPETEPDPIAVWTLTLWLLCLGVGLLGLRVPHEPPRPPAPQAEPVVAQRLLVELTPEPSEPEATPPPAPDVLSPPPPPEALRPVAVASPIAVALPSPAIEFALPVQAPNRIVEPARAGRAIPAMGAPGVETTPAAPAEPPPAAPRQLTFGEGEGKQPAPEYPRQAARQGQEGTVLVQFSVDPGGRVVEVTAAAPSPWPLLNQAALRVVRERWRFREGPWRSYEVAIRFQLSRQPP